MSLTTAATVLVLNRNWQAISVITAADALCQMASGSATGLDVHGPDSMAPVQWKDWLQLPVRDCDRAVGTARGPIRMPTVLVLARYDRVPLKRPKFSARALRERDGNRCQYTGRVLAPGEGNIDHVLPRSRGGHTTWQNCVLACRDVNSKKADRTPEEAGLRLLRAPQPPRALPATAWLRNVKRLPDWEPFLP